jgi:sugar/nucleoside kinase (ribokinase family)
LGNIDPDLQQEVLHQVEDPELVAADTMNYWIERKPESLQRMLKEVDLLIINDAEVRQLASEPNLLRASRRLLSWGPQALVVKRGEYGALLFTDSDCFAAPAYPLETVRDPTGAGDTFAGGLLGYLANTGDFSPASFRKGVIMGSVMASFNVEDFSLERLKSLTYSEIEARYREFKRLSHFEDL